MNIAKLLLSMDNQYNEHYQTTVKGLTVEEGMEICRLLEEEFDNQESFVLELWVDGSFTIYRKDGIAAGQDQMILTTH